MNIFWGRQCAFVFPIYVLKYRKYTIDRWIVVYTVCAPAMISPLKQWLDSYAKTRLKMCHTFKHFIHMQYFLLLTNLVIVFVHWVSTGVLYEPRQYSLFWDYIPESKLCFASICAARPFPYSIRPIQKLLNCQPTMGWVGLWGFLWWAPSAKWKDHHGVSSGWSSVSHDSNTGLFSAQYEQIPIIFGVWPFWLTPVFFRSLTFWRAYG